MRFLLLSLTLAFAVFAADVKITLSDDEGNSVDAYLIRFLDEQNALLRHAETGEEFETDITLFSAKTQSALRQRWAQQQEVIQNEVAPFNESVGHQLLRSGLNLFDEPAADVASRLKWPKESETPFTSSYRRYTPASYKFLGARPYSAVAYGSADGKLQSISLVFANKGDTLSNVGSGEDHFGGEDDDVSRKDMSTLQKAMARDEKAITEALTQHLGEGESQRFGEKTSRRTVVRWDWRGHSFLLTHLDDEYVGLQITPTEFADAGGRAERLSDSELKKRVEICVTRRENGDVFLDHIPMVDQGPKGYCAPATFERAMRYAGVPADMYLLATLATSARGGTNTQALFDQVTSICSSKGRRARTEDLGKLKMRTIKRYIEAGTPIMWSMRSLGLYNETANRRTRERSTVTDWTAYAKKIEAEAQENQGKLGMQGAYHICMIIGYNETTNELAVSDSWGPRYTIRWIHIDEAEAVTSGRGYVIRR